MSSALPFALLDITKIVIPPARQRTAAEADTTLVTSIERDGLINPILVHQRGSGHEITYELVAGERRLDAHRKLEKDLIAATILERLDSTTAFRLELTENIGRKQLSWQDEARAVLDYHNLRLAEVGEMWTQRGTSADLGISESQVSTKIVVGKLLGDPEVAACPTLQGAFNLIEGRAQRALVAAQSRGLAAVAKVHTSLPPAIPINASKEERTAIIMQNFSLDGATETAVDATTKALDLIAAGAEAEALLATHHAAEVQDDRILNADFLEWAETYSGPKFDVLHVDFPYGKGYRGSNTSRTGRAKINPLYLDDPDIYFELVDGLLTHQDNIAFPVAHMLFWFDMSYYAWTIDRIETGGWKLVQPFPLIWTKGHTGVASDPKRRPRHCYETALLFSRGDRRITKLVNDHHEAQLDAQKLHLNQKPLGMLKHFLSLIVDEHTALLDPTCGSGSAITAALQLKAARVLGVELDPSNADVARTLVQVGTSAMPKENPE